MDRELEQSCVLVITVMTKSTNLALKTTQMIFSYSSVDQNSAMGLAKLKLKY